MVFQLRSKMKRSYLEKELVPRVHRNTNNMHGGNVHQPFEIRVGKNLKEDSISNSEET